MVAAASAITGFVALFHPGFTIPPQAEAAVPVITFFGAIGIEAVHVFGHHSAAKELGIINAQLDYARSMATQGTQVVSQAAAASPEALSAIQNSLKSVEEAVSKLVNPPEAAATAPNNGTTASSAG